MLTRDPAARALVAAAFAVLVVGEVLATWLGRVRGGERGLIGSLAESLLYARRRHGGVSRDRGTLYVFVVATYLSLAAAALVARRAPALRAYANDWWTLALGLAMVVAGVAFRGWSIVTLGRYFRRQVTIEPGQRIIRSGPYRVLRHPSYAGFLLAIAGLGLALGSWVGAVAAAGVMFLGMLPRIHVEERALADAFGEEYDRYADETARMIPYVW
jgi:protein-S-isoprenylcysteine O-methyltransferase Ste14